jgi:phage terminase large subunit-like protein
VWDRATSGLVVSVTFPNSRDVIQPLYFDNGMAARGAVTAFIPPRECAEWSVTDQLLKLKNGSVITFRSADSGREKFQGLTRDWVHLDEEPPKPIFEEIVARVGAGRGLRVFISATLLPPEGMAGGISWLYEELIRPWQSGTRPDVAVFGASIYDNPHLGRDEILRLEALYQEGSAVRRIRLYGEWLPGLTGARAYPAFDRALHVGPAPAVAPYLPLLWKSHSELRSLTAANFRRIGSPARESDLPSHAGRDSSPRPDAIPEADILSQGRPAMKSIGVVVLIALLLFVTVAPAAAQNGGVYVNPLGALLLFPFAVAATITGGVATVLTAPFAYAYAPYPATYGYQYPYSYPYAYAAPASVYATASAPAPTYWYYCASARTYYPYISTCPERWMRVVPTIR